MTDPSDEPVRFWAGNNVPGKKGFQTKGPSAEGLVTGKRGSSSIEEWESRGLVASRRQMAAGSRPVSEDHARRLVSSLRPGDKVQVSVHGIGTTRTASLTGTVERTQTGGKSFTVDAHPGSGAFAGRTVIDAVGIATIKLLSPIMIEGS